MCDKNNTMPTKKSKAPITDLLRKTIVESGISLKRLALETGIARGSLIRFRRGETSLRLDIADKLADYFGLELVKRKGK
jgi:transcriptional regulator with XRE-family HTH domain